MANRENQKLKLLWLLRVLWEETDERHGLTAKALLEKLSVLGFSVERKSLYTDIEVLRQFGLDIELRQHDRAHTYHLVNRPFSLAELKLLTDAVQSFKLLPEEQIRALTDKIQSLTSRKEAMALSRQLVVTDRVHHPNDAVCQSVDLLYSAIAENRRVTFRYFDWNLKKQRVLRHGGRQYEISPWLLIWEEGNYYLVAFDCLKQSVRHYRVDRMTDMALTDLPREGREAFEALDPAGYGKGMFGMFGGQTELVRLRCLNKHAGIILERFGQSVTLFPDGADHFTVTVRVVPCDLFYAWVIGFGNEMQLCAPPSAVSALRELAQKSLDVHSREESAVQMRRVTNKIEEEVNA